MKSAQFCYDYARPALSSDIAVFLWNEQIISILLIKRKHEPYAHHWALAGGFVEEGESALQAAHRELLEETGAKNVPLIEFGLASTPGRDPRGWVVTDTFLALLTTEQMPETAAGDDAEHTEWISVETLPKFGFDHADIFKLAFKTLKDKLFLQLNGEGVSFPHIDNKILHDILTYVKTTGKELRFFGV